MRKTALLLRKNGGMASCLSNDKNKYSNKKIICKNQNNFLPLRRFLPVNNFPTQYWLHFLGINIPYTITVALNILNYNIVFHSVRGNRLGGCSFLHCSMASLLHCLTVSLFHCSIASLLHFLTASFSHCFYCSNVTM